MAFVAARLRIRRAGGWCEGKKAYGHTPAEQSVITTIVARRQEGLSVVKIAARLNADGHQRVIAQIQDAGSVVHICDARGKPLGRYVTSDDCTYDTVGRKVGSGDQFLRLVPD